MRSKTARPVSWARGVSKGTTSSKVVAMARRAMRSKTTSGGAGGGGSDSRATATWPTVRTRRCGCRKSRRFMSMRLGRAGSVSDRSSSLRSLTLPARQFLLVSVVDQRLERFGVALDGQDDGAFLDAVGRDGHGGQDLAAVRQAEAQREGAVGPQ